MTATGARGHGHGKVILVGEHAVVHGHAAIAAGLSSGITVVASPGAGRLEVPAWSLSAAVDDGTAVGRALAAVLDRFGARGFDFAAEATIPSRAGVGSSAALAVALARAAAAATGQTDPALIAAAVFDAESVFHGTPSGIDAAAAMSGAVGRFTRADAWRPIPVLQTMTICVGLSGRPRDTSAQVAGVRRLRERLPAADGVPRAARLPRRRRAGGPLRAATSTGSGASSTPRTGCWRRSGVLAPAEFDGRGHDEALRALVGAKLTGAGRRRRRHRARAWASRARRARALARRGLRRLPRRDRGHRAQVGDPGPCALRGRAMKRHAADRRRGHEHRAREVLGQTRRGPQPRRRPATPADASRASARATTVRFSDALDADRLVLAGGAVADPARDGARLCFSRPRARPRELAGPRRGHDGQRHAHRLGPRLRLVWFLRGPGRRGDARRWPRALAC